MKRSRIAAYTMLVLVLAIGVLMLAPSSMAQQATTNGSLTGTIRDETGQPVGDWVRVFLDGQTVGFVAGDERHGGKYAIQGLKPGVYEVRISRRGNDTRSRPMRIWNVVVKPGRATILNITTRKGDQLAETGQPAISRQQAGSGWLEGVIRDETGQPIKASMQVNRNGRVISFFDSNEREGGLYTLPFLKPGVYEVISSRGGRDNKNRPIRIRNVVVKPGRRTILNITLHAGDQLEEVGQPVVKSQPFKLSSLNESNVR